MFFKEIMIYVRAQTHGRLPCKIFESGQIVSVLMHACSIRKFLFVSPSQMSFPSINALCSSRAAWAWFVAGYPLHSSGAVETARRGGGAGDCLRPVFPHRDGRKRLLSRKVFDRSTPIVCVTFSLQKK